MSRPFDPRRPFTRAEALAAGLTEKQLRGPAYRSLLRGTHISAEVAPDPLHLTKAALLLHPAGAWASHLSAARVYGAPLPNGYRMEFVTVRRAADRRRRQGVRTYVRAAGPGPVSFREMPLSPPQQTFLDLADLLGLVDLVVVGDYFVGKKWVTPEQLQEHCAGHPAASRAAAFVRREVDSPMETRLRMLLVLAGLPEPTVNVIVSWEDGRVRYRFDLAWPGLRVAVEYDGRQHRDDLDQWDHDIERDEWMDDAEWIRVPVFSRGIYRRPDLTLERVVKALTRRGAKLPSRLSDEWRLHFPVIR